MGCMGECNQGRQPCPKGCSYDDETEFWFLLGSLLFTIILILCIALWSAYK
jgi:hypothetical protein